MARVMEARKGQTQPQESILAQDDEQLNDRSRCTPSLGKISIAIGILAVPIALLAGIIRVGGDIQDLSVDLVKINTLLQTKVDEISMALKKQSKQIDQLTLQLKNAIDHISSVTENTASGNSTGMQILEATKNSSNTLANITEGLCNIGNISNSTNKVVDDILGVATELQNQTTVLSSFQPISCKDIKRLHPNSQTGYYYINCQTVYCNMDQLCGSGGGWKRLAYLDMSDPTHKCPSGFRPYQVGGKRVCGGLGDGCTSAFFFTNGISYSQICGRVEGYPRNSPDVFYRYHHKPGNIDTPYVDGVSITHGSPRQHVWTFAASYRKEGQSPCPCSPGSSQKVPSFVGNNYYCESGVADPLWDGQDCLPTETNCCSSTYLPWFYRKFDTATTDYIELRVCCDQVIDDEDVPVGLYEIYIK